MMKRHLLPFLLGIMLFALISCGSKSTIKPFANSIGMTLVQIPDSDIIVSKFEVTIGQFKEIMGYLPSDLESTQDNLPVSFVTSQEAEEFCKKLTQAEQNAGSLNAGEYYTLPSYEEWLIFADPTPIKGSVTPAGGFDRGYRDGPLPVGTGQPNKYGLFNIRGNVSEWSRDIYISTGSNMVLGADYSTRRKDFLDIRNKAGFMDKELTDLSMGFRCVLRKK